MPHQVHLRTFGRTTSHRLSMLRNLAVDVLRYERVKTTEAKAKEVRRFVDKLVRLGRDGTLPARRRALALTRDPLIVEKVFTDLRERFAGRDSGFSRLSRLGHRVGDGAPMMLIELLEGAPAQAKAEAPAEAAPAGGVRGIARRLRGRPRAEETPEAQVERAEEKPAKKTAKLAKPPQAKAAAKKTEKPKAAPKAKAKKEPAEKKKKPLAAKKKEKD